MNLSPVTSIPKDWKIVELQTTGDVIYGIQASVANNIEPIGTKIITNKNISLDGKLIFDKINYFEIKTDRHRKTLLQKGDILFNWRSGSKAHVGKVAYFDLDGEYVHSSFILRIRPNDTINGKYLYQYLFWLRESKYFIKLQSYSINAKFNKSSVNCLPTIVPPIEEQKKIASVLSLVQKAIAQQEKAIALTTELKKALMQKLFTEGTHKEAQKQTEIGLIPASWEMKKLGDLASKPDGCLQTGPFGSQLHKHDYQPKGVSVVNPTHLIGNKINHDKLPKINSNKASELSRHRLEKGDILFARRGEIGRHGLVGNNEDGWVSGTGCFLVRVKNKSVDNRFLSYYFSTKQLTEWLYKHAAGAIMPNLNNAIMRKMPVYLPKYEIQQYIANNLDLIETKLSQLIDKKTLLTNLFQTLLHQLMTAKIRVNELNLDFLNLELEEKN